MSIQFKVKEKKTVKQKNKILETLDSKHMEVIKDIEDLNNGLPLLEKQKQDLITELKNIHEQIKLQDLHNFDINEIHTLEDPLYSKKYLIEDQIKEIDSQIKKIQNNDHLNDYFNKTGHLLYYYYDSTKTLENEYNDITEHSSDSSVIMDDNDSIDYEDINVKKTKITDFIEKEDGHEKAELYDKYIKLINDQTFIQKDIFIKRNRFNHCSICPKCNVSMNSIFSEGIQVCSKCGRTDYILIDSEKPSFREPPPEVSYFAYKRINHFNEWLSQFQAKESTEIPQEIFKLILLEMKKERITDLNKVTPTKIREYLKKLKLNKYYEHVPHILNKLNNKKIPLIGKEVEEKLRQMFKEIQAPFMKVCPPTRKNFLSYSYVLHKFVELLGLDHLKDSFHLLKSREKLHQQDQIWKDICKELNWMFIKSI